MVIFPMKIAMGAHQIDTPTTGVFFCEPTFTSMRHHLVDDTGGFHSHGGVPLYRSLDGLWWKNMEKSSRFFRVTLLESNMAMKTQQLIMFLVSFE